jgi:hypothetical protein
LTIIPGQEPTVRVRVTNNTLVDAKLYGWIDYNANGVFDVGTEQATGIILPGSTIGDEQLVIPAGFTGDVTLVFPAVPESAEGITYARFRLSTDATITGPTGPATDGEVEDYRVTILANDFGDAPDSYNLTLNGNEAPTHRVVDGLSIGALVDRVF